MKKLLQSALTASLVSLIGCGNQNSDTITEKRCIQAFANVVDHEDSSELTFAHDVTDGYEICTISYAVDQKKSIGDACDITLEDVETITAPYGFSCTTLDDITVPQAEYVCDELISYTKRYTGTVGEFTFYKEEPELVIAKNPLNPPLEIELHTLQYEAPSNYEATHTGELAKEWVDVGGGSVRIVDCNIPNNRE